ncbi:MAG: hypothetical protein NDJ92_09085 [Thermoanaerobaculia bacterium]|nr:hypothetical protein [Thermoanaerobaculia bacterium]
MALTLAGLATAALVSHAQAPLTCQGGAGIDSANCAVVHYHVRMYRPDTKTSIELTGVNEFASKSACESALAAEKARNASVIDFLKKNEPRLQYQPDVFGACHCDMTRTSSNVNFLDEARRERELLTQQDILMRVRLRLIDSNALPNSELVRSLRAPQSSFDMALWPRVVVSPDPKDLQSIPGPLPESAAKLTEVGADLPKGAATQSVSFPLVDVATPKQVMVTRAVAPSVISASSAGEESEATVPDAQTPSAESNDADAFVNYETARAQAILRAAAQLDDASMNKSIFEASSSRMQLLSNLKLVVETAGSRSALAAAFRDADDEAARLALVSKLFGDAAVAHWAPADAKDVVFDIPAELTGDPMAVLNEATGKYSLEQRRQALYHLLTQASNLTSSQLLWLSDLMTSFL